MAKEVQVRTWCDIHKDRLDERVEAVFKATDDNPYANVIVIAGKRLAIDLCVECSKLVTDLQEALDQYGFPAEALDPPRRNRQSSPAPARYACPEPGCDKAYQSAASLLSHRKDKHGLTTDGPLTCPECPRTFGSPQGLGAHRRSAHGVMGTSLLR